MIWTARTNISNGRCKPTDVRGATLLIAHTQRQHADLLRARSRPEDGAVADQLQSAATDAYRQLDLDHWISPTQEGTDAAAVFRRVGDSWMVSYQGREVHVRDIKGMAVLGLLGFSPRPVANSTFLTWSRKVHRFER